MEAALLGELPDLPQHANIRMAVIKVDPLIVLGTLDFSTECRNFTHPRARAALGDRPAYLLAVLPWSHENAGRVDVVARTLHAQAAAFPGQTVFVLCNTAGEAELFAERGIRAAVFNHNMLIDHALFRPIEDAPRRFDAIYVATMEPFKRHHLMSGLRSGVLAYSRWGLGAESDAYYARTRQLLPNCVFANQPDADGPYRMFSGREIAELCNQARVGLCLSASEGAMRASMEYLLCGLPVVTTPSDGGRDLFFDPAYAITVEPDAGEVAQAVDELIARRLSPREIREAVLRKLRPMRQDFIALLGEIHARENRPFPPVGYFRDPFAHPYEDSLRLADLPGRLAEAEARHDAAVAIDPFQVKTP